MHVRSFVFWFGRYDIHLTLVYITNFAKRIWRITRTSRIAGNYLWQCLGSFTVLCWSNLVPISCCSWAKLISKFKTKCDVADVFGSYRAKNLADALRARYVSASRPWTKVLFPSQLIATERSRVGLKWGVWKRKEEKKICESYKFGFGCWDNHFYLYSTPTVSVAHRVTAVTVMRIKLAKAWGLEAFDVLERRTAGGVITKSGWIFWTRTTRYG